MHIPSPKKYFDGRISHGFVSLYTGKTIIMIATGLLGLFLPIFIFNLFGQNFFYTALYFATSCFLYPLALFFSVKFLNKFGFRRALRLSIFMGAAYYALFYFIDETNWLYFIPAVLIVVTLYRILYWVPYHVDFAKFTDPKNRGREVSVIWATREVIGIFIPLIAGFVIVRFGFDALFITSIILYLVSGIPYITIPRTREKFSWGYMETLKNFFSKQRRKEMIAFASDGAERSALLLIWPIFIFQVLKGDYLKIGIISTFIIAFSVIIQLILGKKIDMSLKKEKVLKVGSALSSISWFIKIFIETTLHVFVIGAFHNLTRIFMRTPFQTLSYEIAADQGHYVDEYTVIRELAINLGRTLILVLAAVMSIYFTLNYLFILAAIASILLNLLRKNIVERV
ncbi:MFS transporter [Patescibacteria group bacterium]